MRVVVTGAAGLLGSAIVREFADDASVIPLDRHHLDVTDPEAVSRVIAAERPDVVINCAAYNLVDQAEDDPRRALDANAFAVRSLARAAAEGGAALVHYSSDFVFDGLADRPYREEDRANPASTYGASKYLGELFALDGPGRAYVLRVESLFGPPSPGGRRGSLGVIVDGILEGREVQVFVDRVVSPSHTPDIARATRHLIVTGAAPGLYHCVNSGSARWSEIAARAAELLGHPLNARPVTLETMSLRARRPRYCALDNGKLASTGFVMPTWQDALARYLS